MNVEVEFLCKDGISRFMRIDAEATSPFGFYYQDRVMTPHGQGSVIGVNGTNLYFVLDHDTAASFWSSCRSQRDFLDRGFYKIAEKPPPPENPLEYHRVKKIEYRGSQCTVLMQSVNGPCPVLALSNALLLKGVWKDIAGGTSLPVRAEELRGKLLQELLLSHDPVRFLSPHERKSGAKTIAGVMANAEEVEKQRQLLKTNGEELLRRFYMGLDVSPCFSFVDGFDGEPDALLFALAGVRLFHSWFITEGSEFAELRDKSYDEIMLLAASSDDDQMRQVISRFTATFVNQSSPEGLQEVHRSMDEGEVAVLFLNNHFGTIVKLADKLLRLASDESFADKPFCVFEVIWDEDGGWDGWYCDGEGFILNRSVLRMMLQPTNRHTFDEVMTAFAQAVSEGNNDPSVADLEAKFAVPAVTASPAKPTGTISPPFSRNGQAVRNEPFSQEVSGLTSTASQVPLPVDSAIKFPTLPTNSPATEGKKCSEAVAQLRSMGFDANNLEELLAIFGTVNAVVDHLLGLEK